MLATPRTGCSTARHVVMSCRVYAVKRQRDDLEVELSQDETADQQQTKKQHVVDCLATWRDESNPEIVCDSSSKLSGLRLSDLEIGNTLGAGSFGDVRSATVMVPALQGLPLAIKKVVEIPAVKASSSPLCLLTAPPNIIAIRCLSTSKEAPRPPSERRRQSESSTT